MLIPAVLGALLLLASLILNVVLILKIRRNRKAKKESLELREFLVDLFAGDGLVRVTRIAPADMILRSPRSV